MEQRNLTYLINSIKPLMEDYKHSEKLLNQYKSEGKLGSVQKQSAHLYYIRKKLRHTLSAIKDRITKPGTGIKFQLGEDIHEGIFPSLSPSETTSYVKMIALVEGKPLKILEIWEIKSEIK